MRRIIVVLIFLCAASFPIFSRQVSVNDNARPKSQVVPGPEYDASWIHRFLFGSNWRDLWTTPITAEVLDLQTFAGGLTPKKTGGGKQTLSLRFVGRDGKQYKFRSIDKDARRSLPPDLQESIAGDFLQDQISSQNPTSAIIVSPLLDAVGVLNSEPRIVVLPNDPALGKFQSEFGGVLGTIEENPTGDDEGEPGFAGADEIIQTFEMFKRLEADNLQQVDAREFLKARLMDMYLGDWDRHADQWRWAGFRHEDGSWLWKPIPRDRDWAFSKFGGVVPTFASETVPELKAFGDNFSDIEGLTWKGRHLDRRLLVGLNRAAWDSLTRFVVSRLTDSVIDVSVHRLPPEIYAKEGASLERALKTRRSGLAQASEDFYQLCAGFPDIRGTKKREFAEIDYQDDHSVRVTLSRLGGTAATSTRTPVYSRTFNDRETKDIRVYLLGGDDSVDVHGDGAVSTTVRVIENDGNNELVDRSRRGVLFYESGMNAGIQPGSGTTVTHIQQEEVPEDDVQRFEPYFRDYGHRWKAAPWFEITPDYGLFIGGGPVLHDYGFMAHPEVFRMELRAGIATTAVRFRLDYLAEFYTLFAPATFSIYFKASQLESFNFFGFGNETPFSEDLLHIAYYRVHQQQVTLEPAMRIPVEPGVSLSLGGRIKYVATDLKDNSSLSDLKPYGSQRSLAFVGAFGDLTIDSRDNPSNPSTGVLIDAGGSFMPKAIDNEKSFTRVQGDARTYLSAGLLTDETLALRVAGEKVWGDQVPFFELPSIGGAGTVRAYDGQRFTGNASLYGSAEGRISLGRFSLLVPGTWGFLLFADAGKVYLDGVTSSLWHSSVGGGLWLSFINRANVFQVSVSHSHEKTGIYLGGGFMF